MVDFDKKLADLRAKKAIAKRIADATAGAAPNMNPVAPDAPPAKEVEVIPGVKDVIHDRAVRLQVIRMTAQAAEIGAKMKALKVDLKPLTTRLKSILGHYQERKMLVGDTRINYYDSPRRSIKADKLRAALLGEGMSADRIAHVIDSATSYTTSYTLKITPLGQEEDDDE